MKKKEKRMILILIVVAIAIIAILWFATRGKKENTEGQKETIVQVQEDGSKVNVGDKLHEKKEIDGFTIENVRFTEKDGMTQLRADVTNRTSEAKNGFLIDIVLYDKSGKEIGRIPGNIIPTQPGETIEVCAGITGNIEDYLSAYNFKMEKK